MKTKPLYFIIAFLLLQGTAFPETSRLQIELLADDEHVSRSASLATQKGRVRFTKIKGYDHKTRALQLENHLGESISVATKQIKELSFTQTKNTAPTQGQVRSSSPPAFLQEKSYLRVQVPLSKLQIKNNRLTFSYNGLMPEGSTPEAVEIIFGKKSATIVFQFVVYAKKKHKENSSGGVKGIR